MEPSNHADVSVSLSIKVESESPQVRVSLTSSWPPSSTPQLPNSFRESGGATGRGGLVGSWQEVEDVVRAWLGAKGEVGSVWVEMEYVGG